MIPYVKVENNNNIITCNADFVVLYNSELVLMSLVDIAGRVKKTFSDIVMGKGELTLLDRERHTFEERLRGYSYYGEELTYKYKLSKYNNKLTHGIILNNNDNYIFDWEGKGLIKSLTLFLRSKHYLPITEEIVQKVIDFLDNDKILTSKSLIEECDIYTNKEDMKNVGIWHVKSVQLFKEILEKIELNKESSCSFDWDNIEDISDYLITFADSIKEKLNENVEILFDRKKINEEIFKGLKPYDGQVPIIQGGIEALKQKDNRFVYLASDPGVGKTSMGTKINHVYYSERDKNNYCSLVVAPTTTLTQWKQEIKETISDKADVIILSSTNEFIRLYEATRLKFNKPTYILVGKETFKLSYKTEHGVNVVKRKIEVEEENKYGWTDKVEKEMELCLCPDCGVPLINPLRRGTVYLQEKDFNHPKKSNYKCSNCNSILWQAVYVKNRKTSVIDFIKRRNIKFDSVIVDEVHESNNFDSIIGAATREIMKRGKKIILLSGTVTNGYASSIYNILFALIPNILKRDNVFDKKKFIQTYGTLEAVTKNKDNAYHITSRTQLKESDYHEVEGINPLVFTKYFANNFIFTELSEIRDDLPELNEHYIGIEHDENILQSEEDLKEEIKRASPFNASFYNDSVIKHYTNKPFGWNQIPFEYKNSEKMDEYIQPKNYEIDLLPKEEELIGICAREKEENRKVWIYIDYVTNGKYTEGEALIDRLKRVLEKQGLSVYALKSSVRTMERKNEIEKRKEDYDVFISNPKLVNVGLNMQWCPTYIFFSPTYHVNIVRQASKRGLRVNSTEENRVYHLYYDNGIELDIMERFKLKLAESESVQAKFDSELNVKRTASSLGAKIEKELVNIG